MFEISPEDIERFDGQKLGELLRVLVYAEARKAGVPLRNVAVPLQITIADGGQDASVRWENGEASTPYFSGTRHRLPVQGDRPWGRPMEKGSLDQAHAERKG